MPTPELEAFGQEVLRRRTAKGWTLQQLAHEALGNQERKGYLSQVEKGRKSLSPLTIQKIAKPLDITGPVLDAALGLDLPEEAPPNPQDAGAALDDLRHANRDMLDLLAARFQIPEHYDLPDARLRAELEDRAKEYRTLRKQVDALDERTAGLANLKAAAQDALDRLDFEEVEARFADIHATEQAIATETAIARADNLLLLDRQQAARDVLLDAADAYKRTDRLEWLRFTHDAALRLYEHGLKRSGPVMAFAASIWFDLAAARDRETEAEAWASAQNNLGNALTTLGERGDADALRRAVDAYEAATEVHTRDALPVDWAMTQNNLGIALLTLGQRGDADALRRAVAAYEAATEVRTRDALPVQWATTQNNLGNALLTLGERGDADALRRAVDAYEAALEVRTRDALPVQWAVTQTNLGNALATLGARGDADALHRAVDAYKAALEVRTRDALPVDWAMTRFNMALCFEAMAAAFPDEAEAHRAAARAAVEDALTIYDPEAMAFHHQQATALRDRLRAER